MKPYWNQLWRRRPLFIAVVVLVAGLVRLPGETRLLRALQQDGFHPRHEGVQLVDQLGVQSFIGILGGLRYMVASFLSLQAVGLWETQQWEELAEQYRLVNLLQPRDRESWSTGAWHLAYNASAWYQLDAVELTEAQREAMAQRFIERGKEVLEEGIRWNPDDPWLHRDLANIYREKDRDPCRAADHYLAASRIEDAPGFMFRFYGYLVADCPGREEESYEALRAVYEEGKEVLEGGGPMIWKPTLIVKLRELEEKLGIPAEDRIPERFDEERFRIISPLRP